VLQGIETESNAFSALVRLYLMIDLGSFLASHKSKIFLAETAAPVKPPKQNGGTSPFWQPSNVSFGWGAAPKISGHFLKKQKGGWVVKGFKRRVYRVMG
jgi:hypothetical protein